MDEARKPNDLLRQQRELRGWSQRRIAQELATNENMISRWERGERKPSPFYQEQLCRLFGKSAEDLGFIDRPIQRPTLVLLAPLMLEQTIPDHLDHLEQTVDLAWELWFASRPKQAAEQITRLLPDLEYMLYAPAFAAQTARLKELAIRSHGLLGAIALDTLQNSTALFHYTKAHKLAADLNDANLAATYLALIGDTLRRQSEKEKAISHMEQAAEPGNVTDRAARGHILQLLAYTYADTGNEAAFERTISEAADLLAFTGEGRDSTRKEFVPFEIYEIRGKANRDLGKPLNAISYLELAEKSLHKTESVRPRWHALLEISRGQAYCDAGDLTTGIDVVSRGFLMAYQCHSPRQMNRVRKLLRKLEESQWKDHQKVAELRELVYETYFQMDAEK